VCKLWYTFTVMKDLFFLNEYPVEAGFTTVGKTGPERREEMVEEAKKTGKTVIRPIQVHSDIVVAAAKDKKTGELLVWGLPDDPEDETDYTPRFSQGLLEIPNVDGVVTDDPSLILTSSHGDCLPVYMYDPIRHAIGLCHSGWKGCLAGISVNMLDVMEAMYGSQPEDIITFIGPGIGFDAFEVGPEVAEAFLEEYPWMEEGYIIDDRNGKYHIDLKGMTMELLELCGNFNSSASDLCTYTRGDLFWSYRRNGAKERMMAYMSLKQK